MFTAPGFTLSPPLTSLRVLLAAFQKSGVVSK
jgi:hypothetical protein